MPKSITTSITTSITKARSPRRAAAAKAVHAAKLDVRQIRARYGVSRSRFHRLTGFSERALANWEGMKAVPDESTTRRLRELDRLHAGLSRIIRPEFIAEWMDAPNPAFDGLKPIEVIERGEIDRLWRMIFELGSGGLA